MAQDPSQGQAPAEPAPSPEGGGQGNGGIGDLIGMLQEGLMHLAQQLQQAGLPPEQLQGLGQVIQGFQGFVQSLSSGGDQGAQEPVSPEAGAAQTRPAPPQ